MSLIILILVAVALILLIRLFGAWMLRIDEVITNLKAIVKLLEEQKNTKP